MTKYLILIIFLYYFNEVLGFNWMGVRMMCWVRVHLRISLEVMCISNPCEGDCSYMRKKKIKCEIL